MSKLFPYFFVLAILISNCAAHVEPKSKTLVLNYAELGPQVLVYEIVGYEWFQWNNHGDSDPNSFDDVKIVVYRDISLERVKAMYPTDEKRLMDYRYIEYKAAIDLLQKHEDDPYLERLRATKKKIIENLGS